MKLYDCRPAPSPRRVRVFIAEKGLEVPTVQVDLAAGEQYSESFRQINPRCTVPVLELADGTRLTESLAICAYLEALHPSPPLMGRDPLERALILQWNARIEVEGLLAVGEAFRNRAASFRGRALTGSRPVEQIPALVERGRVCAEAFLDMLDAELAQHPYVVGSHYSLADITALVAVDFAGWIKLSIGERQHLARWHRSVSARPSALA
jgi:glutathione S-transferase